MRRARISVVASGVMALFFAGPLGAQPSVSPRDDPSTAPLPPPTIRIGGALAVPFSDLANESPREGWVGGQEAGFTVFAGVRVPAMTSLSVRPELVFYSFGRHVDPALGVILVGAGGERDTVEGRWTRETLMGGLRIHLEYIPADRTTVTPFLSGGLGFMIMRVDDEVRLDEAPDIRSDEVVAGASAFGGVGLLVGRTEILLSITVQEPGFTETGRASWITGDLGIGFTLPFPR